MHAYCKQEFWRVFRQFSFCCHSAQFIFTLLVGFVQYIERICTHFQYLLVLSDKFAAFFSAHVPKRNIRTNLCLNCEKKRANLSTTNKNLSFRGQTSRSETVQDFPANILCVLVNIQLLLHLIIHRKISKECLRVKIAELLNFKQKGKDMNEFIKVPLGEKLSYCFGDPALTLMYTMTTTLLIYFYTNVVGISVGAVGMIMLLSRVFDGFSDVAMGTIIDRTHSKYGKARIWILRLALPYAIAAILLFTMPNIGDMGKIIYAFVTYNIMNTVVYTAISQPFHALGSLMSRDQRERDTISNIRMILSITASMVITAFTLPLINYVASITGNQQLSWILVTAGYAVISVFVLLNTYASCTERVQAAPQNAKDNIPFGQAFKATVTNRYFLIALGLMIFYTAYQIIIGTDLTYYCQYVLGNPNLVMPLSAAEKICTIIGIALLPALLPRFGKRKLICVGCAIGIIGQLLFLMDITSVPLGVVSCIIRGFGIAPFYGVQYSLPSDAIEYGHWKNGVRVEGLMFSSMSMGQKAGSGITSAIMSGILAAAGFDGLKATAAEQAPTAIAAIKDFYLYVPIALWAVMLIIALFYGLDKTYKTMMAELLEREGKAAE